MSVWAILLKCKLVGNARRGRTGSEASRLSEHPGREGWISTSSMSTTGDNGLTPQKQRDPPLPLRRGPKSGQPMDESSASHGVCAKKVRHLIPFSQKIRWLQKLRWPGAALVVDIGHCRRVVWPDDPLQERHKPFERYVHRKQLKRIGVPSTVLHGLPALSHSHLLGRAPTGRTCVYCHCLHWSI